METTMPVFRMPDRLEELRDEKNFGETYLVKNVVPADDLDCVLREAGEALNRNGTDYILEHFDTFYSCLVHFQAMPPETRQLAWKILLHSTIKVQEDLEDFFEFFQMSRRKSMQIKLSMICYAFISFADLYLECVSKKKDAKKDDVTAEKLMSDLENGSVSLAEILGHRINSLFEPYHFSKTFMHLVTKFAYKVLEKIFINTSSLNARTDLLFKNIADLITISVDKYENANRNAMMIIQMFQTNENFAVPMAALVAVNVSRSHSTSMILDMIRQIKKYQASDLSRDSSCPRAIKNFLVELCHRQKPYMFKCMHEILELLGSESHYLFRNAALEIIAIVIEDMFPCPELKRDQLLKEMLLEKLEAHIHDVSTYSRNKCLQMWAQLATKGVIPINHILDIVRAGVERLEDKSSFVRKSAMGLLTSFLIEPQFVVLYSKDIAKLKEVYGKAIKDMEEYLARIEKEQASPLDTLNATIDWALVEDEQEENGDEEMEQEEEMDQDEEEDKKASRSKKKKGKRELSTPTGSPPKKKAKMLHVNEKLVKLASAWFSIEKSFNVWWVREGRKLFEEDLEDQLEEPQINLDQKDAAFKQFRQAISEGEYANGLCILRALQDKYPEEPCFQHFNAILKQISEEEDLDKDDDDNLVDMGGGEASKKRRSFANENDIEIEDENQEPLYEVLDYNDNLFIARILKDELDFDHLELKLPSMLSQAKLAFLFPLLTFANLRVDITKVDEAEMEELKETNQIEAQMNELSFDQNSNKLELATDNLRKLHIVMERLEAVETYRTMMSEAMPKITELMSSKITTDVTEAMSFIRHAHKMRFSSGNESIRRMLNLINSKEKSVKDGLIESFESIFLNLKETMQMHDKVIEPNAVAAVEMLNICHLISILNLGECFCARSLIGELYQRSKFSKNHLTFLWQAFSHKRPDIKEEDIYGAIKIMGMIAFTDSGFLQAEPNLSIFFDQVFGCHGSQVNVRFVTESLEAFNQSFRLPSTEVKEDHTAERFFRLPQNHTFFKHAAQLCVNRITVDPSDPYWCRLATATLSFIYNFAEQPDPIGVMVIKRSYQKLKESVRLVRADPADSQPVSTESGSTVSSNGTPPSANERPMINDIFQSRFVHLIGQLAMNVLIFLEVYTRTELIIRKNIYEKKRNEERVQKKLEKKKRNVLEASLIDDNDDEEDNYDDKTIDQQINKIDVAVRSEVLFNSTCILNDFRPVIEKLAFAEGDDRPSNIVQQHAIVAMTRLMFFCPNYSKKHLTSLLKAFDNEDPNVRQNMIVCLADVVQSAPNCFESHCRERMLNCLRDPEDRLRMIALRIISRLILSSMIRPKTISILRLVSDPNEDIAEAARLFFVELSKSSNDQLFTDSCNNFITHCHSGIDPSIENAEPLDEENFKLTAKFLFELETRPGAYDFVLPAIIGEFRNTNNPIVYHELSYILSLLTFNETGIKGLVENFPAFEKAVGDDIVNKHLAEAINNYRKCKSDPKGRSVELEDKIKAKRNQTLEDKNLAAT